MQIKSALLSGLLATAVLSTEALAHAPAPLPLHHLVSLTTVGKARTPVFTNALLLKSLSKPKNFALPVSFGSGSQKAFQAQLKAIANAGFSSGQSSAIINQALVSNGLLSGTLYGNLGGGNTLTSFGTYYQAYGSNPLNDSLVGEKVVSSFGPTNVFSLTSVGGTVLKGSKSLVNLGVLPKAISGSQKAYENIYKNVASGSILAGQKSAQLPGTVLGGVFYGRYYYSFGGGSYFSAYSQSVFAFGNSAYNSSSLSSLNSAGLRSYIEFSNGATKYISNAGIYSTFYEPSGGNSYFRLPFYEALGSNPLTAGGTLIPTYKSYIYF